MKKILYFFIFLFSFISFSFWADINGEIKVINNKNQLPLKNLVIIEKNNIEDINKYLTTDNYWKIYFTFPYDEEGVDLNFNINWNQVILQKVTKDNNKNIEIYYDEDEQKIKKINFHWNKYIKNQEIIKLTNYTLLTIFIFFTLIIWTIILFTRIYYLQMLGDIKIHKNI